MAGPAPLFDSSPAEVPTTPAVPERPDPRPTARLRAVLLVALLTVGIADLAVVRQSAPARSLDAPPIGTPPPVVLPTLVPPATPPTAGPSAAASTAASAAASTAASAQDAADVAVVRRYYALLPARPGAAFALLGRGARAQSGGYARFAAFYGGIAAVSIDPAPAVIAPSTVAVVIRFRRLTGEVTHERYELVVGRGPGGTALLRSYRRSP